MQADLLQRITINPEVCHGKPTLRNMRYTVSMILDLLSARYDNKGTDSRLPGFGKGGYISLFTLF